MEVPVQNHTMGEGVLAERLAARGFQVSQRLECPGRSTKFRVYEVASASARGRQQVREGGSGGLTVGGGSEYAAKVVSLHCVPESEEDALRADLQRIRQLAEHPNVMKHHTAFLEGPSGCGTSMLYLVTPFAADGDMAPLIAGARKAKQDLPQPVILEWARQLLGGLEHLHRHGIVHRGVIPSNILFFEERRRVCISSPELPTLLPHRVHERGVDLERSAYLAPELVQSLPSGAAADMWALGCVCFELVALSLPFPATSLLELPLRVMQSEPAWSVWTRASSNGLKEAVGRLLCKDPEQRPTASELLEAPLFASEFKLPTPETWASLVYFVPQCGRPAPTRQDLADIRLPNLLSAPHGRNLGFGDRGGVGKVVPSMAAAHAPSKVHTLASDYSVPETVM